jgi:lipid A disaccharide synthetase
MLKQQTISTSMGQLTVSSLTLGELRQLDALFQEKTPADISGLASVLRYLPVILNAVRKVHQDLTAEQIENDLTFDDFNALFNAVLEVSGLKKATAGEPTPVPV